MEMPESVAPLQVIQVIGCRGAGVEGDPIRHVIQFYSMDGRLLAESDPVKGSPPSEICSVCGAGFQSDGEVNG
jgi:hypothetical protein